MIYYYDIDGQPHQDVVKCGKQMEDSSYSRIGDDLTPGKQYRISTIWLGLDHDFGFLHSNLQALDMPNPHPIIFETMVFDETAKKPSTLLPGISISPSVEMNRYSTKAQALRGHKKLLRRFTTIEQLAKTLQV